MCFVYLEVFDRVPRNVLECAMRKDGIPEVLVRSVLSLYKEDMTRFRVSQELEVKMGGTNELCCGEWH